MSSPGSLRAAGHGLDVLNLFVANVQTGFGPFIAVYLTTRGWTQTSIGIALSIGTIAAMVSQIPAGAVVDMTYRKSIVAGLSLFAFAVCALLFAVRPFPVTVYLAEVLHGFSGCTLGPSVAAMSLALVGSTHLGPRLGRNALFSSVGNATGAALMGAFGYYLSSRSVFFLAAALTFPAIAAVWPLRALDARARDAPSHRTHRRPIAIPRLLGDYRLLIFCACAMLFTFSNAAMMPIVSVTITEQMPATANLLIAAFIVLPQLLVAAISPSVGRLAHTRGRRILLVTTLGALGLRGLLFAAIHHPVYLIPVQLLDGISAACFGVLMPLVAADIAGQSGRYSFTIGFIGFAIGIGATISTTVGGIITDHIGESLTLLSFGAIALATAAFAWFAMPETRPASEARS
ncbi:MAG TPA: MFS transporter [Stellaceae bacterium]|nr:MFS transporter [Stellaceae bacterium]